MDRREFLIAGSGLPVFRSHLTGEKIFRLPEKPFKNKSTLLNESYHRKIQNILWDKIDLPSLIKTHEGREILEREITFRLRFTWASFFGLRATFYQDPVFVDLAEFPKDKIRLKSGRYFIGTKNQEFINNHSFSFSKSFEDLDLGLFLLRDHLDVKLSSVRCSEFDLIKLEFSKKIISFINQENNVWTNLFNSVSYLQKNFIQVIFFESHPFTCTNLSDPLLRTLGFTFYHSFGILIKCED